MEICPVQTGNRKAVGGNIVLKPYWGKPAVRNFREGGGNIGIIKPN